MIQVVDSLEDDWKAVRGIPSEVFIVPWPSTIYEPETRPDYLGIWRVIIDGFFWSQDRIAGQRDPCINYKVKEVVPEPVVGNSHVRFLTIDTTSKHGPFIPAEDAYFDLDDAWVKFNKVRLSILSLLEQREKILREKIAITTVALDQLLAGREKLQQPPYVR